MATLIGRANLRTSPSVQTDKRGGSDRSSHRQDIQGLRAVAVVLVVASHVGLLGGGFIGVDVFFVISGYLITGLLAREATRDQKISIIDFYARRGRRIIPAATVVALATLAAVHWLLGPVRALEVFRDSVWIPFFAINWKFANEGTDYFASGLPPSPFQHYWSLAVEEQFYLVWPALMIAMLFLLRRHRPGHHHHVSPRRWTSLLLLLIVVAGASLAWSVHYTATQPTAAYFSSLTRVWELAAGAILALGASAVRRVPGLARALMAWVGVVGIAASSVMIGGTTPFPGWVAVLPILSTMLVIAGGEGRTPVGAGRVLGLAPFRWVGDRSYSLYLWHWPFLVVGAAYLGGEPTALQNAYLVAGAVLATILTYKFIEHPIHQGRSRPMQDRSTSLMLWPASAAILSVVAMLGTTTGAPAVTAGAPLRSEVGSTSQVADDLQFDPRAAVAQAVHDADKAVPAVTYPPVGSLRDDNFHQEVPAECYVTGNAVSQDVCHLGPPSGSRTVVVMGDSHAGMFLPVMKQLAEANNWTVYYFVKTSCTIASVGSNLPGCDRWRSWALAQIAKRSPDMVMLATFGQNNERWAAGLTQTLRTVKNSAKRVVLVGETPSMAKDPVTCIDRPGAKIGDCMFSLPADARTATSIERASARRSGAEFLNLLPWLCFQRQCPLVVKDTVVYFDPGHLSASYTIRIRDALAKRIT